MNGGHAIVFVDPMSEASAANGRDSRIRAIRPARRSVRLLTAWGVDFDPTKVVTDADLAQPVQFADRPASRR